MASRTQRNSLLTLLLFNHSVVSDSLWPVTGFPLLHYLGVCSNSCPLNRWCHPIISSLVIAFSSCLQSFPASGSVPVSWLFASSSQSFGASASVLPMNIGRGWFPLRLTDLISLLSKGLSQEFSLALQFKSISSLVLSLLYGPTVTSVHDYWKNYGFDFDI